MLTAPALLDTELMRMNKVYSDEEICQFLQNLTSPESIERHDKTGNWFSRYNGFLHSPEQATKYVRGLRNTLKLAPGENLQGKAVLDVGSGFGLACVVMHLLGAQRVEGIDTFLPMVETTQSYAAAIPELRDINFQSGLSYDLPFEDGSFDIILNFEALSHFVNQEQSIAEAARVLKKGGKYVIADDNNGANPRIVKENREIWERFENGPPGDIHGHDAKVPYVESREKILREAFPELSDDDAKDLALNTSYMLKKEVIGAGERFIRDGVKPSSRFQADRCPVEPHAGQLMENLIDPRELDKTLMSLGCQCETVAYFGGDGIGGIVKLGNSMLNALVPKELLIQQSAGFKIHATRVA